MITALVILIVFLSFTSGLSKSICDLSEKGVLKFKPAEYWLKALSSVRKYQYKSKVVAYLMKTILVMFTDGWHLFQFVLTVCLLVCGYLIGRLSAGVSEYYTLGLIFAYVIRTLTFHLFYTTSILKISNNKKLK